LGDSQARPNGEHGNHYLPGSTCHVIRHSFPHHHAVAGRLDASIVSVTAGGLITAHQPGTTRITATAEGKSGFANPVVNAPAPVPVARIEVSPGFDTVEEGATRQLTATVYDADENVLTGRGIVWTSLEAEIAHVDGGGLVTALRPGITTITARVEGKSTTAEIRVEAYYPFELLYGRHAEGLAPELYTLDFKDPAAVALPVLQGGQPAVSPDGARIAFVVSTSPGTAIHTAKRDGSDVKVLISDGNFNEQPTWSPDGNFIAFRRQVAGENSNIWMMNAADGADAVNLTAVHGEDASQYSPAWSPVLSDGTSRIAYAQFQGGQQLIWTMRSDGTDHRQTTFSDTAADDQPAWSPDGQKIVFQRSDAAERLQCADQVGKQPAGVIVVRANGDPGHPGATERASELGERRGLAVACRRDQYGQGVIQHGGAQARQQCGSGYRGATLARNPELGQREFVSQHSGPAPM
jgi:hypothetical protein